MEFKYQQQRKQEQFKQTFRKTSNLITTRLLDSLTKNDMSKSSSTNQFSSENYPIKCYCGLKAELIIASKPNQNIERLFFACSRFNTNEDKNRCSFFRWENEIHEKNGNKPLTNDVNGVLCKLDDNSNTDDNIDDRNIIESDYEVDDNDEERFSLGYEEI
ncbi:5104_t:CDS:2 [Ambispora gerdemannii]|uniref:5104_t:CDS:1 n=1 Tax=Ambispora gerdemannii TaxID=144530 RepID=A0A9N9FPR0_9GLOM|nr:5104_t:CDS:2 [Ambispora gerdemannii]